MEYYKLGDWVIKESNKTCWIYKKGICYCRFPTRKHIKRKGLKDILENFILIIGALNE